MSLGKFNIDDTGKLSFGVTIEGDYSKISSVRLVLMSENYGFILSGELIDESVDFDISSLKGLLVPGAYQARLEIALDENKLFVPVNEAIEFTKPAKVEAVVRSAEPTNHKTTDVHVSVSKVSVKKESDRDKWIKRVESMGCLLDSSGHILYAVKGNDCYGAFDIFTEKSVISQGPGTVSEIKALLG